MTNIISTTKTNTAGNGESSQPALDTTGKFVAFASDALNLSIDAFGLSAIYLKNTQTGDLTSISTNSYGEFANSNASNPSISGDGRYVVFQTAAANLTTNDKNSANDIFLKDTQTGALNLVAGIVGDGESLNAKISNDGHYVVFQSVASNFVSNDFNGAYDIYLQDLQTNTLKLISTNSSSLEGNHASYEPSLSANGSMVAFTSDADNLIANDNNVNRDVFVKNISSGTIQLISKSLKGVAADGLSDSANGLSDSPSLNSDGTKIAFRSFANDLIANSKNDGNADIYVKDLTTQKLTQINFASDGSVANGTSWNPQISPDGKFVAFISDASNLVSNDNNDVADVFLKNLSTGELRLLSDSSTGTGNVVDFAFSGDSSTLAFSRLSGLEDNATTNVYSAQIQAPIVVNNPPTGSVIISGTATQGQTLNASNTIADLDGLGTFSYQWLRNDSPIQGESKNSHILTVDDVGKVINVVVNYIDGKNNAETVKSLSTELIKSSDVTPSQISQQLATSHAQIYLQKDSAFVVSNNGVKVHGASGNETTTIIAGSQGVELDGNVDALAFINDSGSYASIKNYMFKQLGTTLQIFDNSMNGLPTSVSIQDDSNGTLLYFDEGVFSAQFGLSNLVINGSTIGSNPVSVSAKSTTSVLPTISKLSKSSVFLAKDDVVTINNDDVKIYGNNGNETVTLASNAKNVILDQSIEHLIFSKNKNDYMYAQKGNALEIYDSNGQSTIAKVSVQDNGTLLTFNDGSDTKALWSGANMLLGDFALKFTPSSPLSSGTNIDIQSAGVDDATGGNKQFFVHAGNYVHEIKNFQVGDAILFPNSVIVPTVINENFTDGKMSIQYASNGQTTTIELTGLSNDTSISINSFKAIFGSTSIGTF